MESFFKIKERGSTVRTEIIGGLTTFFAMAYIIFVNPSYLSATGMEWGAVFMATCISAAIGCILTALLANAPFAQAPGMGLNAFFAFTVATGAAGYGMGYTWQQALAIVFLSGLIFLVIVISPLRTKIISSIPASLKAAISGGIGLFIAIIGMLNSGDALYDEAGNMTPVGIITLDEGNLITGLNLTIDGGLNVYALLTIIGVLIIAVLMAWKVKGAIFIGIILTTIIGFPLGVTQLPDSWTFSGLSLAPTFLQMDFPGLLELGWLPLVTAIVSFALVDMFDTVGTLVGTASNNNMLDEDGNMDGGDKALVADAIATVAGAALGTSTVTTFVESSTGISEGARTGLSSIVVGLLFLLAIVVAPVAGIIPGAATAPALIIVGVLMLKSAARVAWDDIEDAVPAFFTISIMPFAYSISDGIGFGFISYTIIKVLRGKANKVPLLMYIVSALFILMYILKGI